MSDNEMLFANYKSLTMHRVIYLHLVEAACDACRKQWQNDSTDENFFLYIFSQAIFRSAVANFHGEIEILRSNN